MKAIDRVYQYLDFKGIRPTRFEKDIGLSNGYLKTQQRRNADLGEGVLIKIIENSLDLSIIWLITGKGDMIGRESAIVSACPSCMEKERVICALTENNSLLRDMVSTLKDKITFLENSNNPELNHASKTA